MSNISLLDNSDAFKELLETFRENSVRYFLIGGLARDLQYHQKEINPPRITRDIDFAVMVATWEEYERLKEGLIKKGFSKTTEPYRMVWSPDGTIIDLLPFGSIERGHSVFFPDSDLELVVAGFKEVLNDVTPLSVQKNEENFSIYTPPLHGLFLLKLLSWNDKRPEREKDLDDLIHILENYWEFVEDEAYKKHLDLFDDDNFETQKAAARILGRQLRETLDKSTYLKETILSIIEKETYTASPGPLARKFTSKTGFPLEKVKSIIEEILLGIKDEG